MNAEEYLCVMVVQACFLRIIYLECRGVFMLDDGLGLILGIIYLECRGVFMLDDDPDLIPRDHIP